MISANGQKQHPYLTSLPLELASSYKSYSAGIKILSYLYIIIEVLIDL